MTSRKRIARVKLTIAKRAIDGLESADKPWIAQDDKLTGFGVLVHPPRASSPSSSTTGPGTGGRTAPNKRLVIGRCDRLPPEHARRWSCPSPGSRRPSSIAGGPAEGSGEIGAAGE